MNLDIPGLVDLQVNGFLGVDFSGADLTAEAVRRAWRALIGRGTAAFLPTLITSPEQVYARNLPLIAGVMAEPEFAGHVLGVHLEGPFISAEPGAVGAHNPAYTRLPDQALLARLLRWGQGQVRMLTLAAELPGAEAVTRAATEQGILVSIGHSLFTAEDLDRAYCAGARALTHLGNGLPNLLPRHPNPLWDGLADERYTALIISDGHHLPDSVLRVMARARGRGTLAVVSDAAPIAGLPPGEYTVLGNRAVLEPSGRLHNPDKACLVGSSATMMDCLNHLAALGVLTLDGLLEAGYYTPLRLLGLSADDVYPLPSARVAFEQGRFLLAPAGFA